MEFVNRGSGSVSIKYLKLFFLALLCISTTIANAERAPVLQQIKVPHDYYFREMYLPQVTTGPSSPGWSPDGKTLVYSMQGSLWRQALDSSTAVQLTAGPGYDYQPDWSPDGRHIVFVRYNNDAMELQLLELASGRITAVDHGRGSQHGTALVTRWIATGFCIDQRRRTFSRVPR
jgi:TolB protein